MLSLSKSIGAWLFTLIGFFFCAVQPLFTLVIDQTCNFDTPFYNKNILVRKIIIIRTMMHKNMQSLMGALSLKRSGALTALPMRFRSYGGLKD